MRGESRRWQLPASALLSGAGSRPERFQGAAPAVDDVIVGFEEAVAADDVTVRDTVVDEPDRHPPVDGLASASGRAPASRAEPPL